MKLIRAVIAACTAVAAISIGAAQAADKVVLRFSSVSPPPGQSLDSDGVKWWMDKVTERTKGQVTFEPFWGCRRRSAPGRHTSSSCSAAWSTW